MGTEQTETKQNERNGIIPNGSGDGLGATVGGVYIWEYLAGSLGVLPSRRDEDEGEGEGVASQQRSDLFEVYD